jgi:predicted RNA binding protein YcfA (HicA-like mRNA interferase family)
VKIPRDVNGADLARALRALAYERVRQDGSHIRLSTNVNGTHHFTVPNHRPLKMGTLLGGVLKPVAAHHKLTVEELSGSLGCSGFMKPQISAIFFRNSSSSAGIGIVPLFQI